MSEINNSNNTGNQPKMTPIARTGGIAKVTAAPASAEDTAKTAQAPSAEAAAPAAAAEADIFSEIYREQKVQSKARDEDDEIERQKEADRALKAAVHPVVPVVNLAAVKENEEKEKKFKIVFIILIILTGVIFLSSLLFLIFGQQGKTSNGDITEFDPPENMISATLVSPFTYQKNYGVEFPEGMKEEFKDLYAQNQDFVGWLTVPGTCIDMPCYQTKSGSQYYLKHDNYDQYTKYGIPFLDHESNAVNLSRNTVIYGHNFDDGLIFDELHNYQDPEYYKQYPIIEYSTLYADYKFKIIAAFHTNGSSTGDKDGNRDYLFYYVATSFGNNSMMKFYEELMQRSYIHTGVDVRADDKLITLSTCTYFFDRNGSLENARFAVIGRLVREGESESIDTSLVTKNENVRYPQLYYDVFGGTNPWRNSTKWVPEID